MIALVLFAVPVALGNRVLLSETDHHPRFEGRYKSGIALARILAHRSDLSVDRERVFSGIIDELRVDPYVWKDRRLLDKPDASFASAFADDLLRTRIQRTLEHVFTLLSLALDRDVLKVAFRGLHTDDQIMRSTALEYLEVILPTRIHDALQPWLGEVQPHEPTQRAPEAVEAEGLKSSVSIDLRLQELLVRSSGGSGSKS